MYAEFATDPVMQSLAFEDQRHFVVLLCFKCNGTLDKELPVEARDRSIYRGLGLDETAALEVKRRLMDYGLIDLAWHPVAWDRRQYRNDNSNERVKRHREKRKQAGLVAQKTIPRKTRDDIYESVRCQRPWDRYSSGLKACFCSS